MAIGIILILLGFFLFALPYVAILSPILILYGVYRTIKGLKKFIFDIIDHIKE